MIEPGSRGVLDPRLRGDDSGVGVASAGEAAVPPSKGESPAGWPTRGVEPAPGPRNHPVGLDFRQPDFPLVTKT
jgi:hypothetical protein